MSNGRKNKWRKIWGKKRNIKTEEKNPLAISQENQINNEDGLHIVETQDQNIQLENMFNIFAHNNDQLPIDYFVSAKEDETSMDKNRFRLDALYFLQK